VPAYYGLRATSMELHAMIRSMLIYIAALVSLSGCGEGNGAAGESTGREAWVTVDRLNRRTCPDESCGSVGVLFYGEKATIYEESGGWARTTRYYDASCRNGRSEYIDSGNASCDSANGIVDERLAEWVSLRYLSSNRPDDPATGATGDYALVSSSDDYRIYKDVFARAASELIASGQCTRADFEEMGGWIKSENHRDQPIYFTYCGGMRLQNRLYLDASTGKVSR
jgi:hypothetical protein